MLDHELLIEIRRDNLRQLASEFGGVMKLSDKTGKDAAMLSKMIGKNAKKPIGEQLARDIEALCGKPRGWLDKVHGLNDRLLQQIADEVDGMARDSKRQITTKQRDAIISVCYRLAATLEADRAMIRDVVKLALIG